MAPLVHKDKRDLPEQRERVVSLVHLEQWVFMENEVLLACRDLRETTDLLDVEETLDLLDNQESVELKVLRDLLDWLVFQLRKENEVMVVLVENKDQLVRKDPEEFQESLELKVSKALKDQLEAQVPKEEMVSQDLKEVLVHLELLEIRVPKVMLETLVLMVS